MTGIVAAAQRKNIRIFPFHSHLRAGETDPSVNALQRPSPRRAWIVNGSEVESHRERIGLIHQFDRCSEVRERGTERPVFIGFIKPAEIRRIGFAGSVW